jgi:hypothetical protein
MDGGLSMAEVVAEVDNASVPGAEAGAMAAIICDLSGDAGRL